MLLLPFENSLLTHNIIGQIFTQQGQQQHLGNLSVAHLGNGSLIMLTLSSHFNRRFFSSGLFSQGSLTQNYIDNSYVGQEMNFYMQ
jgi:hypothetical protein